MLSKGGGGFDSNITLAKCSSLGWLPAGSLGLWGTAALDKPRNFVPRNGRVTFHPLPFQASSH